jgi:hypothetical protein
VRKFDFPQWNHSNHEEAFEELEQIDAPLRGHPSRLEVRWGIYASIEPRRRLSNSRKG